MKRRNPAQWRGFGCWSTHRLGHDSKRSRLRLRGLSSGLLAVNPIALHGAAMRSKCRQCPDPLERLQFTSPGDWGGARTPL